MKLLRFSGKVNPLDWPKVIFFEPDEISILRTLVQDHLNTLSDIAAHYAPADVTGYLGQLETLESKLKRLENETGS